MKTKKIAIVGLSIVATFLLIGVSYAYFSGNISGAETSSTITMEAGNMTLIYDNKSGQITINDMAPQTAPVATKSFQVTGNNETEKDMAYRITLAIQKNEFLDGSLTYTMTSTNTSNNGVVADPVNSQLPILTGPHNQTIGIGSFAGHANGAIHNYTINLYFPETDEDQNSEKDKKVAMYVKLEPYDTRQNIMSAAADGTLLHAIGTSNKVTAPITAPGKSASGNAEKMLAATEDDYGMSYYFRGAVENNYIMFANMCWRIVRVVGNGAIKIVLYNYNPNGVSNACDASQDGTSNAFIHNSYNTLEPASFNNEERNNRYVGFMYGGSNTSTYEATHNNANTSNILNMLMNFYTTKLGGLNNKIADTIWCKDISTVQDTTYDPLESPAIVGGGFSSNKTYYKGTERLMSGTTSNSTASPTLICPNDDNGGKISKLTAEDTLNGNGALNIGGVDYKIGLLTSDEIAFAGSRMDYTATNYHYLTNNATNTHWWTMTPLSFTDSAKVWAVNTHGNLTYYIAGGNNGSVKYKNGVRPAISLIPETIVTGEGTSTNPYIVQ